MAKSIINPRTKEVRRISDAEASDLVKSGQWKYVGKFEAKRLLAAQSGVVSAGTQTATPAKGRTAHA